MRPVLLALCIDFLLAIRILLPTRLPKLPAHASLQELLILRRCVPTLQLLVLLLHVVLLQLELLLLLQDLRFCLLLPAGTARPDLLPSAGTACSCL